MKYYFLSGFFHVSLLFFLVWYGSALELEKKKSKIVIEIISLASDEVSGPPRTASLGSDSQKRFIKNKSKKSSFKFNSQLNRDQSDRNAGKESQKFLLPQTGEQELDQERTARTQRETDQSVQDRRWGEGEAQDIKADYARQLKSYIERNKFYPRLALKMNQVGVVKIRLEIAPSGVFKEVKLIQTCAYETLNKAALKLIKDLKGFKPLPENFKEDTGFIVPIAYEITGL